jgi:TrmH family RNA methyltransferase
MLTERSGRIREARKLTRRAGRAKAGRFLAEGQQAVREALAENRKAQPGLVHELYVAPSAAVKFAELVDDAIIAGVPVHHAEDAALAGLSETVTPQGIVAVCEALTRPLVETITGDETLVAILAEARDPGNAGTVIRAADAAGAGGVVLTHGSVDPLGGKAVRASAGSLFHLPTAVDVPLDEAITHAKARGLTVLAADGAGTLDLDEATESGLLARPTAWIFGNEAWGMPTETRGLSDHVVRVPIYGRAESLNLATAAAVCLYASARALRQT